MTQDQINRIITQSYSEKIQMCTMNGNTLDSILYKSDDSDKIQLSTPNRSTLDYLLYKSVVGGLKQFKGYSAVIESPTSLTETDFRTFTDDVITDNLEWFNS
jgi:hypothetical protein